MKDSKQPMPGPSQRAGRGSKAPQRRSPAPASALQSEASVLDDAQQHAPTASPVQVGARPGYGSQALPAPTGLYEAARLALEPRSEAMEPGPAANAYDSIIAIAASHEAHRARIGEPLDSEPPPSEQDRHGHRSPTHSPTMSDIATAAIAHKDTGAPTDPAVRSKVEAHTGADFGDVRVHSDPLARQATHALGARAFAYGSDIFLGPGESGGDVALMAHELTHVIQQGGAGDTVQRQVDIGSPSSPAEAEAVADRVTSNAPPEFLLRDSGPLEPGQMECRQFLRELRVQVTRAAEQELGPLWSALGCPYIDRVFERYQNRDARTVEALVRRYSGVQRPGAARDYMAPMVARVRKGVRRWRNGQDISGDLAVLGMSDRAVARPGQLETGTHEGRIESTVQRRPKAYEQSRPGVSSTYDSLIAIAHGRTPGALERGTSGVAPEQGANPVERKPEGASWDPAAMVEQLGEGESIDRATASAVGSAYGESLSDVRVHTDSNAARLAASEGAAAFTVGRHIAFAQGRYQPGTPEGDALLAHELAHVVQQRSAEPTDQTGDAVQGKAVRSGARGDGQSTALEADADAATVGVLARLYRGASKVLSRRAARARPALRSGLALQRCSDSPTGYEHLPKDRQKAVEDYTYRDVLTVDEGPDLMPPPMKFTWGPDPFELEFSRQKSGSGTVDRLVITVKFIGKHIKSRPTQHVDNEEKYSLSLPRKGPLNVLVEPHGNEKLTIWPYGMIPNGPRFEFTHEGPNYHSTSDGPIRNHYFTFRGRMYGGYISGSFTVADKNMKPTDYPEDTRPFYRDTEEGKGLPVTATGWKERELRFDGDGDYYKELVMFWQAHDAAPNWRYDFRIHYIPSDKEGRSPQKFSFTLPKSDVGVEWASTVENITDGGSDFILRLGTHHTKKPRLRISPPKVANNKKTYRWRTTSRASGELAFPLEKHYQKPDSNVELVGSAKSTTRIWGQDVKLGPWRDRFRVTASVADIGASNAFVNVRAVGRSGIHGTGGIKVPLTGVDPESNPFDPAVLIGEGMSLKLRLDREGLVTLSLFDKVTRKPNFEGTEHTRKHIIRVTGNTITQDYNFEFNIERNVHTGGGGLAWDSATTERVTDADEKFRMDAKTVSLDVLASDKTFFAAVAEYERELFFVKKKAKDEGLLDEGIYNAWARMNGAALMLRLETTEDNKNAFFSAVDAFQDKFAQVSAFHVTSLKAAVEAGSGELAQYFYFQVVKPLDKFIIEQMEQSGKPVVRDLGMKVEYLLDYATLLNDMRTKKPVKIPATFLIEELYRAGKQNYGHAMELYAYREGDRLHLKNITNRKEINHVETGISDDQKHLSTADLVIKTDIISKLDDPDWFPEGEIHFRVPGYTSAIQTTEGGMSAADYAKIIGAGIAAIGLVLIAIASFGALAPESAAGIMALGTWVMFTGDMIVLGASVYDILADRYNKGHFDTKSVLINVFDAATALLSAGTVQLGRIAWTGARAAVAGEKISRLAKFAGKWYIPVQLAEGAAGVMGVIMVMDSAIQQIKALSKMEEGEAKNQAAISLFWHLLSIGTIGVLGLAGSKRFMPNSTDLLTLRYAKVGSAGHVPIAHLGGIARFTRSNIGEFENPAAAWRFIENSIHPDGLAWFNARYPGLGPADKLKHLEGIERAWEPHGLDINGALTVAGAKRKWRGAGKLGFLPDASLAATYSRMGRESFIGWSDSRISLGQRGVPDADAFRLLGVLEESGHTFSRGLNGAEADALWAIDQGLSHAYLVGPSYGATGLGPNIAALVPHFTTLQGALGVDGLKAFKVRLSTYYVKGKLLYGRQKKIHAPGTVPTVNNERRLIGAHSGKIYGNPDYRLTPVGGGPGSVTPSADKPWEAMVSKLLHSGPPQVWSTPKRSTLAPTSWSDAKFLEASMHVAMNGAVTNTSGTRITYEGVFDKIKWRVITDNGVITMAHPLM